MKPILLLLFMVGSQTGYTAAVSDPIGVLKQQHETHLLSGKFNAPYNVTVNDSHSYGITFSLRHTENSTIRLTTAIVNPEGDNSYDFPLQIVVRQQTIVQAWELPLELNKRTSFPSVSRTLCSVGEEVNASLPVTVEVSTFSPSDIEMYILAELFHNFTLSIGPHYNIYVTPTSPTYYQYTFATNNDPRAITLHITSAQNYVCSTVYIQTAECPVADLESPFSTSNIVSQTFLESAVVIITNEPGSYSVFIVFRVSPSDQLCTFERTPPTTEPREKQIEFWIESPVADTVYIYGVLAAVAYSLLFYLCTLLTCLFVRICNKKKEERRETTPAGNAEEGEEAVELRLSTNDPPTASGNPEGENVEADPLAGDNPSVRSDIYRLKPKLMVSDLATEDDSKLDEKYKLYFWNIVTISIFYGLPAVQLVLTYQKFVNASGYQDICYFNFQCARKLGVIYTFNNIFSNISYVLLGILFMLIVRFRKAQHEKLTKRERKTLGIPQYFGLPYAMGWALMIEGVMSASYHVCPSSNNFQFDTAFMYILGGMLTLRLFQSRHPDINANAQSAFLLLALIIMVTVFGVLFNGPAVWYLFFVLHILVIFYISLQIYYAGLFKLGKSLIPRLIRNLKEDCCKCMTPGYRSRFVLLVILNLVNLGMALYGVITQPEDFASFMLAVIIVNLMGYCAFYIAMKLFHKERIPRPSIILGIVAMGMGAFSLYLFTRYSTNWFYSPAESRNHNTDCYILDFYDTHDVWHFLSAGALFCIFVAVLLIDEDLRKVPRTEIPVF